MPLVPADGANRNLALDGMRGLACLIVVFWHLAVNFFPAAAWGVPTPTSEPWELALYRSPLRIILSGGFAVSVFFVLSGYVLTIDYFRHHSRQRILQRILGRPLRLGVLASASTLAIWFGSSIAPNAATEILVSTLNTTGAIDAVAPHLNLAPDLSWSALAENLFWLPWFKPTDPRELYNGVLWTMHVELLGSLLVMTLALVLGELRSKWLVALGYIVIAAIIFIAAPTHGVYFAIFLCGSAIAALDPQGGTAGGWRRLVLPAVAILGLILGAGNDGAPLSGLASTANYFPGDVIAMGVGAVLVFAAILTSRDLSKVFAVKPLVFLGSISFALYVTHTFVIFVLGMSLFALMGSSVSVDLRVIVATLASLGGSIALAIVLTLWIDRPAIRLAKALPRLALRDSEDRSR